jgi:hypothetical protein
MSRSHIGVAKISIFILCLVLGCAYRRQAYDIVSVRPLTCPDGKLASFRIGRFSHMLWRECRVWLVPPFFFCSPLSGLNSNLIVSNDGTQRVSVSISRYQVRFGSGSGSVDPSDSPLASGHPLQFSVQPGGYETRVFRFRVPHELSDASLHIEGTFGTDVQMEPFECTISLVYKKQPLTWTLGFPE